MPSRINNTNQRPTIPAENKKNLSRGQKAADWVTSSIGSWTFIIALFIVMALWMTINTVQLIFQTWDPYPYILLNFGLSSLAAVQAPIILMSQNRTSERDRIRFEYDYHINRKAEREIMLVNKELRSIKNYIQKINQKIK
ncbi:hypothetical protein A2533_00450 [Candidatus Falkowbacteria bacterium RIFOXYD2_FULL_35_9]|uniref:Cyclic nucleotide-binding protein n=1 Tax=Candidatus Falkowbacteria bacterium RIFOXYC2_FULL_36_12 TaxID=1798002 RepID=A0A1F5T034_9BACT|nr:MAG: hypothetical protein A2300_03130 [Candidatus Falkowbacteria bacterium RIFOXYB2_FULL_35_7]OGF32308.1 MAG: hypothetical protein A2478_03215 [Candidatus Falkowbacteria bacterium RIFOXYC2_FULL_36_12]OGF46641.1 MAG: hypothetical protein A2533_00450 [Candidatus Falkowbacteria bacterium RIFOXYD2_FULL_35_9]